MIKAILYCLSGMIFLPAIAMIVILFFFITKDYPILSSYERFFETPVSWLVIPVSAHLGVNLLKHIVKEKLSDFESITLHRLSILVPSIFYMVFMLIALSKLAV